MRAISLYYMLPGPLRDVAATLEGYRLRRWRYGKEFRRLLPGAVERMTWTAGQLAEHSDRQVRRLMELVPHVPYYREVFRTLGIDPMDIDSVEALTERVPVTEKQALRERPVDFVDGRLSRRRLRKVHTSGTTGTPLTLYRDRTAEAKTYAYFEARWRLPHGVDYRSNWTFVGGKAVVPRSQTRPPFWVWNHALNQRYMSQLHLGPRYARAYAEELRRRPTRYLYGSASALALLAGMVQQSGCRDVTFEVAISSVCPLYDSQRRLIGEVFGCPVVDTYGCVEACFFGYECRAGRMHVSTDAGVFEIVDEAGKPCPPGRAGDVVCTSFVNFAQPLIRYRMGDRAAWAEDQRCDCGCAFPVLDRIDGRREDVIVLEDGRRLGSLNNLFKADLPVVEAQVVQESPTSFRFRIVPGKDWDQGSERALREGARQFLGDVAVRFEYLDAIPRGPGGKFKAVVSNLTGTTVAAVGTSAASPHPHSDGGGLL